MPRIDLDSCQPFRAWNRLEPRTRDNEFDRELECGVHDALWMLTRQWQMGELQGEDAGSAVFAKVATRTTPMTKVKTFHNGAAFVNADEPLERWVERLNPGMDLQTQTEMAYSFLQALERAAAWLNITDFSRQDYRRRLASLYPLADHLPVEPVDSEATILKKAEKLANTVQARHNRMASQHYFNGLALYGTLVNNRSMLRTQLLAVNATHGSLIDMAFDDYQPIWANYFNQPSGSGNAWVTDQLEYQFRCAFPVANGNTYQVLRASEYFEGDLDWYSFDFEGDVSGVIPFGTPGSQELAAIRNDLVTLIPTEAKFAGAPNSRWWQFENGAVDLGNISAEKTDIARMVTTEYALLYGNDWMMIPLPLPVGTLCEIRGIIVQDVFGDLTFIASALQGQTDNWAAWGMFNLSTRRTDGRRDLPVDTRSFIPPATVKVQESEPVEEVKFIRDEMTNSVWAIETQIPDGMGGGMDGHNFAIEYRSLIDRHEVPSAPDTGGAQALLNYSLGNTVPENWIPFIPVKRNGSPRNIMLQRASMPRLFRGNYSRVRPRTSLLRAGINLDNTQSASCFINEEEVSRAGVKIQSNYQRTRWYNGSVFTWLGYRKETGRGEGSSGLKFDSVSAAK